MTYKIAIIVSRFNEEITELMEKNALKRAAELGITPKVYRVPGAIEIPIIAEKLSASKKFEAIITLGAVIRGETTHYDYVCNQLSYGCQKVALKHSLPVIFGVLTCETEAQAFDRIGGKMGNKPKEMIDVAVEMINLLREIDAE
ncbi:MAG: 6,7-dimethyl-8-ribityllumazine synthase [Pseudomonadota bacterium]